MLIIIYGLVVGLCLGLTGGGGGLIAVPLLIYACKLPATQAIGISLLVVGLSAFFGVVGNYQHHKISFKISSLIAIGSILTVPLGTRINLLLPQKELLLCFAVLMLIVAGIMWHRTKHIQQPNQEHPSLHKPRYILLVITGIVVGLLAGLFGIGGGFLIVPALVLFADFPMHKAIASALFTITIVSMIAFVSYIIQVNHIQWPLALRFALGSIIGTLVGILITPKIPNKHLQRGFAIVVTCLACFVIIRQFI